MHIGLFFGSFNPIHHGHLIIANYMLNQSHVDKVWFVISPQNPFKETSSLLNENHRLHLVRLAIEGESNLLASDIEFTLPRPSYTAVTLSHLEDKYPQHQFSIILGGDSFQNIERWKNANYILNNFNIYIYNRPGYSINANISSKIIIVNAPLLQIAATDIRKWIKEKKSIRYLLPDAVIEEIEKGGYYRK